MKLTDFFYELPKELIAQEPLKKRDQARLMILDREKKTITQTLFKSFIDYLNEGDCLVLNDTRVVPARLFAKRKTGGKVEIFLLDLRGERFRALIKPSKRIKEGESVQLEDGSYAKILEKANMGRFVEFDEPIEKVLEEGHIPLPPYISREDTQSDASDYQTVYNRTPGATAAPTAGLHFTKELLEKAKEKGVKIAYVTLHTSYGSFAPVKEEIVEKHKMHSEFFNITALAANIINDTKSSGGKVFAVGTTSVRVLESSCGSGERCAQMEGQTDLFIYPGYQYKIVDGIVTNFHLPCSTLLLLISAFAGKDFLFKAYMEAIENSYRFFSYGDAMMIV